MFVKGCDKAGAAALGQNAGAKIPRYRRGERIMVWGLRLRRQDHVDDIKRWLSIYTQSKVIETFLSRMRRTYGLINFVHSNLKTRDIYIYEVVKYEVVQGPRYANGYM